MTEKYEISATRKLSEPQMIGRPSKSLFPFLKMKPGDSFFVPGLTASQKNYLASSCTRYGQRLGCKFTRRTIIEDGVVGIAVFCVEDGEPSKRPNASLVRIITGR